jgi:DNA-binding LacI/PurR family transcriptional regulator
VSKVPPGKVPASTVSNGKVPNSTDVARLAGVSQKTVSRVFNDEPHVTSAVRERVLAAAESLGYRKNLTAAALIRGRSRRIGVVSLGTSLWGPSTLLVAIERAARRAGYSFTVVNTLEGDGFGVSAAITDLLKQGVDGIVLSEPIATDLDLAFVTAPILSVERAPGLVGPRLIVAGQDGEAGGRVATEHLLSMGHKTVWHVAGPQGWYSAQDRREGWRKALEYASAEIPPVLEGDWSPASGYAAGRTLAQTPGVTAVFTANDDMAIGLIRAFADYGVQVPSQVSVVGFDDIPTAGYSCPPLTTVRQEFETVAEVGLERLLEEIEDRPLSERAVHQPLPVQLIVRNSSAPPSG